VCRERRTHQAPEEHIAKLLKKLDKESLASSNRGTSSDKDEKGSNRSEASEDDGGSKKGGSLKMTLL